MQTFRLTVGYHQLIVVLRDIHLQITVITQYQGKVFRQIYTQPQVPATTKYQFTSAKELYTWLQKYRSYVDRWKVTEELVTVVFEEDNVLKMAVKRMTDPGQLSSIALKQLWECRKQQWKNLSSVLEAVKKIKQGQGQRQNMPEKQKQQTENKQGRQQWERQKLPKQDQQFKKDRCQQYEQERQRDIQIMKKQIEGVQKQISSLKQQTKAMKFQLQSLKRRRSMEQENQATLSWRASTETEINQIREQLSKIQKQEHQRDTKVKKQLDELRAIIKKANQESSSSITLSEFKQLKQETKRLKKLQAFSNLSDVQSEIHKLALALDHEIRIKQYAFQPDLHILKSIPSLKYLNNRTLKSLEDVKDYLKIVSKIPLKEGKQCVKIKVISLKNNGLMFGVCGERARQNLRRAAFNDFNIISINSCGYLVNCGNMTTFTTKIQPGDSIKMIINKGQGQIKWYCNNSEFVVADLGSLEHEEIYPIIGLGNLCDEVELINEKISRQYSQSEGYWDELARLNLNFGGRIHRK